MQRSKLILSVGMIVSVVAGTAVAVNIETVPVGDPGNAADTASHSGNPAGQGSVGYAYNVGKYEVTAGQYCDFLNAVASKTDTYGLYNSRMWTDIYFGCRIQQTGTPGHYSYSVATGYANRPVGYESYWDACRFANWLNNGQPTGDQGVGITETGTYTLNGYTGDDGRMIQRNPDWHWAVTSEDEWYKAAYYSPATRTYYNYPIGSDSIAPSMGNYNGSGHIVDVGSYAYPSPYGTYDQGGNVWEWNEAIPYKDAAKSFRGLRGGNFAIGSYGLQSSYRNSYYTSPDYEDFGFRVVYVPEPATLTLLALAGLIIGQRRFRH